jgi:hypothetical protein
MWRVKKEKRTEPLDTHERQDWTGKFFTCDFPGSEGILEVYKREERVDLDGGLFFLQIGLSHASILRLFGGGVLSRRHV